uniref:Uncharacterized protein n=1 Tax=Anguilla anguilla TaxID=7936 RepID=A0A0E9WPM3_ANGAN
MISEYGPCHTSGGCSNAKEQRRSTSGSSWLPGFPGNQLSLNEEGPSAVFKMRLSRRQPGAARFHSSHLPRSSLLDSNRLAFGEKQIELPYGKH